MTDDQAPLFDLPSDEDLPQEYVAGLRRYLRFIREHNIRGWFVPRINVSGGRVTDWKFEMEETGRPTAKRGVDNASS